MKKIITLALALMALGAQAWTQRAPFPVAQCQAHAPYGFPQVQLSLIHISEPTRPY